MNEILPKLGIVTLLGVATPVAGDLAAWSQWGLAGLVVAFSLWRDQTREARLSTAIERQQAWVRDTLTKALGQNTAALQEVANLLKAHRETQRLPPCSCHQDHA